MGIEELLSNRYQSLAMFIKEDDPIAAPLVGNEYSNEIPRVKREDILNTQ